MSYLIPFAPGVAYVKSPLNYTGGKFKLLPQIAAKIPRRFDAFYDVFSGGANVGVNATATRIVCVDKNQAVIELLRFLAATPYARLNALADEKIAYFGLSDSWRDGYAAYNCESSSGLGNYNKEQFNNLRAAYNSSREPLLLLLLVIFSFNNQIRFNSKGEFNLPVGKRDFNGALRKRMRIFLTRLRSLNIEFVASDFKELNIRSLKKQLAFLYLDPPYSLGLASYNENGGWSTRDDADLMDFLLKCRDAGLKFALSNVALLKGQKKSTSAGLGSRQRLRYKLFKP